MTSLLLTMEHTVELETIYIGFSVADFRENCGIISSKEGC